jgi:hypothetical protein
LFDVLPIELVTSPGLYPLESPQVDVADDGLTRPVPGKPANARVSVAVDAAAFMQRYVDAMRE